MTTIYLIALFWLWLFGAVTVASHGATPTQTWRDLTRNDWMLVMAWPLWVPAVVIYGICRPRR